MSHDLGLGLFIGVFMGAAWMYLFIAKPHHHHRQHSVKPDENEVMKRHLHDLEMDIERGKTP